jgi:PAS domain S-box-containing protein
VHASIVPVHAGQLEPAASAGQSIAPDERAQIESVLRSMSITGESACPPDHTVFGNLEQDARFASAVPVLRRAGIGAAATLPVRVHGKVNGLWVLYAGAPDWFGASELERLKMAAADLGRALEHFEHDAARKRAEDALSRSERRFQEILEQVSLVAVVLGLDGRVTFCNEFGARLLGWAREEMAGKDWFANFLPGDNRDVVRRIFLDNIGCGSLPVHYFNEVVTREGLRRMISWSNLVLRNEQGEPVGSASIGEDITERRAAEEALRDSEARYRFLFKANPLPMWVVDTSTRRFLAANDAAVRQYGYSSEEFLAMSADNLRAPDDVAAVGDAVTGLPASTVRHRTRDGSIISVEVHGFDMMYGDRPARLVSAHDITEMRQLEDQFRQSQKMEAIGRLAGGVAHDFNNLLMAMKGYTELALSGLAPDHPNRADLDEVCRAADRGAELTRQLLAFSRRQILKPEILDLNSVVAEMQRMLLPIIGENIKLITRFDPHLCRVRADRGQIGQVLLNLVVNARDAMPQGGQLVIETANTLLDEDYARTHTGVVPGQYAAMSVSDTGTGIPPHVQAHLFEPFFTTKEKDRGSGLGLSTVYGIVRQSGGHVWVSSEMGRGATFRIYIPDVHALDQRATHTRPLTTAQEN